MALPQKGVAYEFYIALVDAASPASFKASPTLAAGDFQVSKDGGAFGNLATLPVVTPGAGIAVKISLSSTEMTADKVNVQGIDAAGAEWHDVFIALDVPIGSIDELWQIKGLDADNDMTVTPTSRAAGSVSQTISGNGSTTTTVART